MRRSTLLIPVAVLLAFSGAIVCSALLARHLGANNTPAWAAALCAAGADSGGGCDAVLTSRWASLPPTRTVGPNWRVQFPVAGLGLTYFTFLLIWFIGVGRPDFNGRRWHLLPIVVGTVGLATSIAYVAVMAWVIRAWCPLCLSAHVVNGLLFVVVLLLRPLRPRAPVDRDVHREGPPPPIHAYPTFRHATVTIALAVAAIGLMNQSSTTDRWKDQSRRLEQMLVEIRDDSTALPAMLAADSAHDVVIRPDDPIRDGGPNAATLVIWSDFQCSKCRAFADALRDRYRPAFENGLTVVFKHYPLSSECNAFVERAIHPQACARGRLADAVRSLAGNAAFWTVHDAMFANQEDPGMSSVESIAALAGITPEALAAKMQSDDMADRIRADIEQGHALGISGTPAVFLNGRRVPTLALVSDAFWQSVGRGGRTPDGD
ncbi:MAG: thioredoxin domain-containing protein [Phycisphaerales bacterium]|nr:thioredoxin domain-containing protein [Phycisphaerales bacterium]